MKHVAIGGALLCALAISLAGYPVKAAERIVGQTYILAGVDCSDKADVPRAVALAYVNGTIAEFLADIKANHLSCVGHTLAMVWLGKTGEQFKVESDVFDLIQVRVAETGEVRYSWARIAGEDA